MSKDARNFLADIFRPRLIPLAASVLLLVALAAWVEASLSLSSLAGMPSRNVLANERDDYGHIMHSLVNLPPSHDKRVVAVGGSSMREGFPAETLVSGKLSAVIGKDIQYFNFSSVSQTFGESLQILETLMSTGGLREGDVFIVGTNPRRFDASVENMQGLFDSPRLPLLKTDALRAVLSQRGLYPGWRPTVWSIRLWVRAWFEGRITHEFRDALVQMQQFRCSNTCFEAFWQAKWINQPVRYLQYAYPNRPLPLEQKLAIAREIQNKRIAQVNAGVPLSLAVAQKIVELGKQYGIVVLLLDLPRDPISLEAYSTVATEYDRAILSLQADGAKYIDWRDTRHFPSSDFHDLDHLLPSQRMVMVEMLTQELQEHFSR